MSGSSVSRMRQDSGTGKDKQDCGENSEQIAGALKSNKFIIKLLLFFMPLEIPFQRFVFRSKKTSLCVAQLRLLFILWIFIKLTVIILYDDCEHSQFRSHLYDWTVYYPISNRFSLVRAYIGLCACQFCAKASSFLLRKRWDTSVIDYLTRLPPRPRQDPSSKDATKVECGQGVGVKVDLDLHQPDVVAVRPEIDVLKECDDELSNLRDRQHWVELSASLRQSFRKTTWCILPSCLFIMISATLRLGYFLISERACDSEPPLLRLVGLIELNFCFIEAVMSFIGTFTYILLVRNDLVLQSNRMEMRLNRLFIRLKWLSLQANVRKRNLRLEQVDLFGLRRSITLDCSKKDRSPLLRSRSPLPARLLDAKESLATYYLSQADTVIYQRAMIRPRSRLTKKCLLNCRRKGWFVPDLGLIDDTIQNSIDGHPASFNLPFGALLNRKSYHLKTFPISEELSNDIHSTQAQVVAFYKCIDSHQRPISYIGSIILIWLVLGLSLVPVLVRSWYAGNKRSNIIYGVASLMPLTMSLAFTGVGAAVYQRANTITRRVFLLCSVYTSDQLASRWNKIIYTWYAPNRCSLKIGGVIGLTYLNILKSISFLISGLTLILNYL